MSDLALREEAVTSIISSADVWIYKIVSSLNLVFQHILKSYVRKYNSVAFRIINVAKFDLLIKISFFPRTKLIKNEIIIFYFPFNIYVCVCVNISD